MERVDVNLGKDSYEIKIQRGSLRKLGESLKEIYKGEKLALVTDSNVNEIYGEKIIKILENSGYAVCKVVIPAGEESKNLRTLEKIYDELIESGIKRGNLILSFGGGVVGDITGFAAATLYRGVDYIQIPTTLLSQVDSSVGGKVAVDSRHGKNLIGNFYHPKAVFIDPDLLKTLSPRFFSDGMAEVIKYGCIRDSELFERLANYTKEELEENLEKEIRVCCEIKARIVEADEKDKGERMLLNFGHTLGHAIEKHYDFKEISHGEAVAVGMYEIIKIGEMLNLTREDESEKLRKVLEKYNLPIKVEVKNSELIDSMKIDKKNIGGKINFIFIEEIGKSFIKKIDEDEIIEIVK